VCITDINFYRKKCVYCVQCRSTCVAAVRVLLMRVRDPTVLRVSGATVLHYILQGSACRDCCARSTHFFSGRWVCNAVKQESKVEKAR
jgi:hypothetical protein